MKQIELNDFLKFRSLSNLKVNDSKTKALFAVSKTNYDKNEYTYELYETDGIKRRRVLNLGKVASFVFESDQTILYPFEKTKEEKKLKKEHYAIYYRYNLETKEKEFAYKFNVPLEIIEVINKDLILLKGYFSNDILKLKDLNDEGRKKQLKYIKEQSLYEEINQIPFYLNGPGFTANKFNRLYLYNVKKNELKQVHDEAVNYGGFKVIKALNKVFYTGTFKGEKASLTNQLYAYDYLNDINETIYGDQDYAIRQLYYLNNEFICYASDFQKIGLNQNGSFYKLKNNKLELLTDFDRSIGNSIGSDVRLGGSSLSYELNNKLYFTTTNDDHSEVYSLDVAGKLNKEYQANGSIDGLNIVNDQVISIMLYKQNLQELYTLDYINNRQRKLSNFNRSLRGYYIAKPKEVVVKKETHEVKGFVLLPKDYDPNKKYPAILDIHGGPKTVYGKVYYHEMQYWANLGYFVFYANPRGSDGKGDAFSDIRGKYGTIDYDDLMGFTYRVLKRYKTIDQNRLFVTGGSYGGFMTNWIIGQTDIFKAAVTQRSITNWVSFYGTSDIGYYFATDQTSGHPIGGLDKLWDQSPMKYASYIKTPLLFIHAEKDYRCPIEQALQLYTLLKDKEVPTKLIWFKEENHDLSRSGKPQARVKRLTEITNWFNKYL